MGRHEIRLRRKRMTSRRIEGHKNYYDVLRRHQRNSRFKKLFKLVLLLIFFLALVFFTYKLMTKVESSESKEPKNEQISYKTSRPGALIFNYLNT